jgi:phosphoenolpyruvate synthase/pyruvate phosphate dikinase
MDLAWHIEPDAVDKILRSDETPKLRDRIGFDRWEPFDAAVVLSQGTVVPGQPAAPGIAVGRLTFVSDPHDVPGFRSRDVVVGTHPLPNLAALLWDASALVTTGGGPAAHLFESARALGIPAVCGVHLDEALASAPANLDTAFSIAVDGTSGRVAVMPW